MNEARSAKISSRFKLFIYAAMNAGVLFFSSVVLVQGASARASLIIYLVSAVLLYLMLWAGFKIKDRIARKHESNESLTNEVKPKKLSLIFKVLIYGVMNFGTFFFSAIEAIQRQMSLQWSLIFYLASAAWINFLLWFLFRTRDKSSQSV
jgi:hypothetical protein